MSYRPDELRTMWEASQVAYGRDPFWWRIDMYGRLTHRMEHGNRDSEFGWEVDHVWPKSLYGADESANRALLNWRSNVEKSDRAPTLGEILMAPAPPRRRLFDQLVGSISVKPAQERDPISIALDILARTPPRD